MGCRASLFAVLGLAWLGLRYARTGSPPRSAQGNPVAGRCASVPVAHWWSWPGCWPCPSAPGRLAATTGGWSSATQSTRPWTSGSTPLRWRRSGVMWNCRTDKKRAEPPRHHAVRHRGRAPGTRVRIAVLDRYDGVVWGASNIAQDGDQAGDPSRFHDSYQRVSRVIDNPAGGRPSDARVTIGPGWGGVWLPTLGACRRWTSWARRTAALGLLRYNLATSSAVVPVGLRPVTSTCSRRCTPGRRAQDRARGVRPARPGRRGRRVPRHPGRAVVGGGAPADAARCSRSPAHLKLEGKYSDGVIESREDLPRGPQPLSPHRRHRRGQLPLRGGRRRAVRRLDGPAGQPGRRPRRVVFGAVVPSGGVVTGADVHAWVEIQVADGLVADPPDRAVHGRRPAGRAAGHPAAAAGRQRGPAAGADPAALELLASSTTPR